MLDPQHGLIGTDWPERRYVAGVAHQPHIRRCLVMNAVAQGKRSLGIDLESCAHARREPKAVVEEMVTMFSGYLSASPSDR